MINGLSVRSTTQNETLLTVGLGQIFLLNYVWLAADKGRAFIVVTPPDASSFDIFGVDAGGRSSVSGVALAITLALDAGTVVTLDLAGDSGSVSCGILGDLRATQ